MVIVFLVVMAGLISLNGRVLSEFKREVELNERRQERKWIQGPAPAIVEEQGLEAESSDSTKGSDE